MVGLGVGFFVGFGVGLEVGVAEPPPVGGGAVVAGVGVLARGGAGTLGADLDPPCHANATYPPSGMVSEPAATEE